MRILVAIVMLAFPLSTWAQAQPKSIDDCESIKEPLAYNACLASFGPARRGDGPLVTDVPPNADKAVGRRGSRRGRLARGRGSRSHAEFKLGKSNAKAAVRGGRKATRVKRSRRSS